MQRIPNALAAFELKVVLTYRKVKIPCAETKRGLSNRQGFYDPWSW